MLLPWEAAIADILATSTDAEDDTPFPSGTADDTSMLILSSNFTSNSVIKTKIAPATYAAHLRQLVDSHISIMECVRKWLMHIKWCISVTDFWAGSWAKYFLAFSYEIGLPPSIKSDKSMSKVGARLPNSEPYDTWHDPD